MRPQVALLVPGSTASSQGSVRWQQSGAWLVTTEQGKLPGINCNAVLVLMACTGQT
jgi:hypothetical protein